MFPLFSCERLVSNVHKLDSDKQFFPTLFYNTTIQKYAQFSFRGARTAQRKCCILYAVGLYVIFKIYIFVFWVKSLLAKTILFDIIPNISFSGSPEESWTVLYHLHYFNFQVWYENKVKFPVFFLKLYVVCLTDS